MKNFELRVSLCAGCYLAAWLLLASPVIGQPSNDEIAGATVIESLPFSDVVNTTTATNNPADPLLSCNASGNDGRTVWYVWTPTEDVTVNLSTLGSTRTTGLELDTVHGLFVGDPGALTEVACVDQYLWDDLVFDAVGGTTYYIKFGEYQSGVGGGNLAVQAWDYGRCDSPWAGMHEFLQLASLSTPSGLTIYYSDGGLSEAESVVEEYEPFAALVRDSFEFEAGCPIAFYTREDWTTASSLWPFIGDRLGGFTHWGDILLQVPIDGSDLDTLLWNTVEEASPTSIDSLQQHASDVGMSMEEAVAWDTHTYWAHEYGHLFTQHVLGDHQPETLWLTEFTAQYARYGRVALFEPEREPLLKQLACTIHDGATRPETPSPHDMQERCVRGCAERMTSRENIWYYSQIQVCAYRAFDTYGFQLLKDLAQFVPWQWSVEDTLTAQLDSVDTIAPGIKECAVDPAYVEKFCPLGTSIERLDGDLPAAFSLSQNYPNPFNPTTTFTYTLPNPAEATLTIYDLLGREVRELASGRQPAGTYEVTFDAAGLSSGVYFYRLQAGDYVETKRMVVVR